MKWNVILENYSTERLYAFNVFDDAELRTNVEKIFEKKYDRKRFEEEFDLQAHYSFWAKIEWETIFTTWPPHIDANEIERIINEYYINRKKDEPLPDKIDVYDQLRANWDRFADYVWRESQK